MVTIDHALNNGDIVEIVTSSKSSGPTNDWLNIAKSSTAKTKIKQWLRKANRSEEVERGRIQLEKYIKKKGYDPQLVMRAANMNKAMKEMGIASGMNELYVQVSNSGTVLSKYAGLLFKFFDEEEKLESLKQEEKEKALIADDNKRKKAAEHRRDNPGIIVKGVENPMVRIARCCNPVPGDRIVGFITKGRGVSVHREDCSNMRSLPEEERARFIDVDWEDLKEGKAYDADICIVTADRKRMFSDISKCCEDMDIHISGVNAKSGKDGAVHIILTLSLSSTQEMQKALRTLRGVEGVTDVYRARS